MLTRLCVLLMLGLIIGLSGCASTETILRENPDPFEGYNRAMFGFNDKVDVVVLKPVAKGYQFIMPELLNDGVTNFFSNINDVIILFNDLLQLKFEQAAMDSSRIVFNTTFGLLGFFDVASRYMDLPKHNEDFGQTLGYWGVGEGYYFVLPLLGPSTTRDVWSILVDSVVDPLQRFDTTLERLGTRVLYVIDLRAGLLRVERAFQNVQLDPYSFQRAAYLQRRRNLVFDGNPPKPPLDFDEESIQDILNNPEDPEQEASGPDGDDSTL
ncbi:MAG: VacJ family lipoprotein [Candidatus Competibacteraceae bacterium]|jgi:phospholipid-binding lipoprotein MlaA|nr:VacJ family lipoprotein [Candidatus Competibacteraceae bacterium]